MTRAPDRLFTAERKLAERRSETLAPNAPATSSVERFDLGVFREVMREDIRAIIREELAAAMQELAPPPVEDAAPEESGTPSASETADPPIAEDYLGLIRLELVELLERIHVTRHEIASLRPAEGESDQILMATDELEGVVSATERATSEILEAAETIATLSEGLADATPQTLAAMAADIIDQATRIIMTCSFQDLTGQRINAAVNTLLYVEQSLDRVVELWGITTGTAQTHLMRNKPNDDRPDKELLHGPQADGVGVSQSDIDAMFG